MIDTADAHGVKSYIFVPCIVYGEGEGFGNSISIQTVAIVKAAKALGRVYSPDSEEFVCVLPWFQPLYSVAYSNLNLELARQSCRGHCQSLSGNLERNLEWKEHWIWTERVLFGCKRKRGME